MKRLAGISVLLLLAGCAGNSLSVDSGNGTAALTGDTQADTTTDFDVKIDQASAPMAMPASSTDRTPVAPLDIKYTITVTNRTNEAVTLEHITLSTPNGPFELEQRTRAYHDVIAPGGSKQVDFWARAQVRDANLGAATPALVRMMIQFQGSQGKRTESFMRDVNGRFSAGIG
jgi:hypothetical protein